MRISDWSSDVCSSDLKAGAYRWGDSDLPMRSGRIAAMNALSVHFRVPPREIVFLHRRLAGVFIMLATLHCEVDGRAAMVAAMRDAHGEDAAGTPRSDARSLGKGCVRTCRFQCTP